MPEFLYTISRWSFRFFPEVVLYRKGQHDFAVMAAVFASIALLSGAATFLMGRISSKRLLRHSHLFTSVPVLGYFILAINTASRAASLPFTPLDILLGLLIFGLGVAVTGGNRWIILRMTGGLPAPLLLQMRTFQWLTIIMGSNFFMPFLLFQMPVFARDQKVFYWGIPIAMAMAWVGYTLLFLAGSLRILSLNLPEEDLSPGRREALSEAMGKEEREYRITVAKRGLLNALAFFTRRKQVIVGVELLDHLERDELKALLYHEEGHLKDDVNIPKLKRYQSLFPAFIFLFMVYIHTDLPGRGPPAVLFLAGSYLVISVLLRKVRLEAELAADRYVLSKGEHVYESLLAGVEKLRRLNSTDPDLAKRLNMGHLDPDEREKYVKGGRLTVPRRSRSRAALGLSAGIALGFALAVLGYLSPLHPGGKWSRAHSRYHSLMDTGDHEGAEAWIRKAVGIARARFPDDDKRLYIAMDDLVKVLTYQRKYEEAFTTGVRTVGLGEHIFGKGDLELVRSLTSMGILHLHEGEYASSKMWFERALELQRSAGDTTGEIINTLFWLSYVLEETGEKAGAVRVLEELIALYEEIPGYEEVALRDMVRAASLLDENQGQRADYLLTEALIRAGGVYGTGSEMYADLLLEAGFAWSSRGDTRRAKKHFERGLELIESLPAPEHLDAEDARFRIAWSYRENGQLDLFIRTYEEIIEHSLENRGALDADDTYDLWVLAEAWAEYGDLDKAARRYLQAAALGEDSPEMDHGELRELYAGLVDVLDLLGETRQADAYRGKLEKLAVK